MVHQESYEVFDQLTDKQREALDLAARGFTSKEIARELEISPHSVDKRIDAVRSQLDAMPRQRLVREFREWDERCHSITGDPFTVETDPESGPEEGTQSTGETLVFGDALVFGSHLTRESQARRLRSGIRPSDLSVGWRLLLVLMAAFLAAAAFVLVAAAGNALGDLLS
ncbi:helix-turn-helix transcriptional regulator [Qipengyuania sp. GH38]|uniref:response regulator transcription factor n=1 Tax=Qipengyuania intermedia TaxID=2867244 RepID=UPI001C87325D|nr:helix-turn-helix transcriptional regulator [Qipengyuania intermedia]MBX7513586.1 helix-turn-helix transcriptional regulator [Qipengyuania intermedia]